MRSWISGAKPHCGEVCNWRIVASVTILDPAASDDEPVLEISSLMRSVKLLAAWDAGNFAAACMRVALSVHRNRAGTRT